MLHHLTAGQRSTHAAAPACSTCLQCILRTETHQHRVAVAVAEQQKCTQICEQQHCVHIVSSNRRIAGPRGSRLCTFSSCSNAQTPMISICMRSMADGLIACACLLEWQKQLICYVDPTCIPRDYELYTAPAPLIYMGICLALGLVCLTYSVLTV
jgi:hypothetical protein